MDREIYLTKLYLRERNLLFTNLLKDANTILIVFLKINVTTT